MKTIEKKNTRVHLSMLTKEVKKGRWRKAMLLLFLCIA